MTHQLKLIAREPTEEMFRIGDQKFFTDLGAGKRYSVRSVFQAMFDAAPAIESEAEKKAKEFLGWAEPATTYAICTRYAEAVAIIRALLAERGIK